jgi:acetyl esterase/lipase
MIDNNLNVQGLMTIIKKVHSLVEKQDLEKNRQAQNNFGTMYAKVKDVSIEEIRIADMEAEWIRVNRAHMKKYMILYCHGGGYMTGSKEYARTITSKLAESTSMDVLSFNYRLAPENPFPAAVDDALKIWDYLMLLGYGARDIIVAGDSAGGNLALTLVIQLKQMERLLPRGLILMSPWTDLTSSGKSHIKKADVDPILSEAYLKQAISVYAEDTAKKNPLVSPLFANFTGFPPTYIQVGENEILLDDSKRLYDKMATVNVSVHLDVYPNMWHVFQMSPFKTAYDAMEKNAEFIFEICR